MRSFASPMITSTECSGIPWRAEVGDGHGIEVRMRFVDKNRPAAVPELSICREKFETLLRAAQYFMRERHLGNGPLRLDVEAIRNTPGQAPLTPLHRAALSPQLPPRFAESHLPPAALRYNVAFARLAGIAVA